MLARMELLTVINARPHGGAAVHGPTHQLSVDVLHVVCRVLLCTLYALCAPL